MGATGGWDGFQVPEVTPSGPAAAGREVIDAVFPPAANGTTQRPARLHKKTLAAATSHRSFPYGRPIVIGLLSAAAVIAAHAAFGLVPFAPIVASLNLPLRFILVAALLDGACTAVVFAVRGVGSTTVFTVVAVAALLAVGEVAAPPIIAMLSIAAATRRRNG